MSESDPIDHMKRNAEAFARWANDPTIVNEVLMYKVWLGLDA
jgi:hypothetical protein